MGSVQAPAATKEVIECRSGISITTRRAPPAAAASPGIRPPPPTTTSYEDIPSPKKAHKEHPASARKPGGSYSGALDAAAAAARQIPGAAAMGGATGGGAAGTLFRVFEGISALLLLSLALNVLLAPNLFLPAATEGAGTAADALLPGRRAAWDAGQRAASVAPQAGLLGLVLLAMLSALLAVSLAPQRGAGRRGAAAAAARATAGAACDGGGAPKAPLIRDVAVSTCLLLLLACAPQAPPGPAAPNAVPQIILKVLRASGAVLPLAAAAAGAPRLTRHRAGLVLLSHALLLLGGLPSLAAPALARLHWRIDGSWLTVSVLAALTLVQPTSARCSAGLVAWQALPTALRAAGFLAPPLAWGSAAAQAAVLLAALAVTYPWQAARSRVHLQSVTSALRRRALAAPVQ